MSPFHYDGFYCGNVKSMIANGTYADFRQFLIDDRRYTAEQLSPYDKEWEEIPEAERARRKAVVVDDLTLKLRPKIGEPGKMVMRREPSRGNNLSPLRRLKRGEVKIIPKPKIEFYEQVGLPQHTSVKVLNAIRLQKEGQKEITEQLSVLSPSGMVKDVSFESVGKVPVPA